jgi:large subunit ribosomal protein L10
MPTAEKAQTIEQAKEWYSRAAGVVFADYRGLKVKEFQQLRKDLAKKGGEIHVIKNTLFRIAAGDDIASIPEEMHSGPTAVAFVYENESECAKALLDFATSSKKLAVKGGFFGGRAMDAEQIESLSKLPPRDVLIAQVIGAIAAPLSNLVGVVEALYADPIRVIGAVADKVAEGSPLPEAAPAAAAEPAHEAAPEPEAAPAAEEVVAEAPAEEAPAEAPSEDSPATEGEEA